MSPADRTPLPWSRSCFVCGDENEFGLRARSFLVGDRVELAFSPRSEYAGWNAVTHGGIIATVLDEVMTWAAIVSSDQACFAADFSVRLRKPLPPGKPVLARAWCTDGRRKVYGTEARLESEDGELFATGTGRYMAIPAAQVHAMHHDLVTTPECWPAAHIFGAGRSEEPGNAAGP
jgi:acyl-coenzyme A thioesterase PaaI-like protein